MSSSHTNDYEKYIKIDKFNDNVELKKIHCRVFSKCYSNNLFSNRMINDDRVKKLETVIANNEDNSPPWICHAVIDMKNDKKYILDGQHRHQAISNYIENDTKMECDKNIYMVEYKIEDLEIESCRNYVNNLLKILNDNMPFEEDQLPDNKISEFIILLKHDKALNEGISYNDKTQISYKSKIHQKELFALFNKNKYLTRNMTINEMIINLRQINHHLSLMSNEKLYKGCKLNISSIQNAQKMVFYLGLKDSAYPPNYWIKFIQNPSDIAI